jgi:hypothetical protein
MYNWRQKTPSYPRFEAIYDKFKSQWDGFVGWLKTESQQDLVPIKYELAYINKLDEAHGWSSPADAAAILKFVSVPWTTDSATSTVSVILKNTVPGLGDLFVITRPYHGREDSLINSLEFRAISGADAPSSLGLDWFATARTKISETFQTMTTEAAQISWGRREREGGSHAQ